MKYSFLILLLTGCLMGNAQSSNSDVLAEKPEKIIVFPNPASSNITILGLKNTAKTSILIFDTSGNLVLQHEWEVKNNALNIPVASLNNGIYTVSISSKEQQVRTKFYKQ